MFVDMLKFQNLRTNISKRQYDVISDVIGGAKIQKIFFKEFLSLPYVFFKIM